MSVISENTKSASLWRRFKANRWAFVCLWCLAVLYAGALFADILAPYSFDNEARDFSYSPPTRVHIFDQGKLRAPFVRGTALAFDQNHRRIYRDDPVRAYPVRFFALADDYKMFGLFPARLKLFTVDAPGRILLLGADSRGRDIFSRILYGARISLTIGLIGVFISFSIGLLVGGVAGYFGGRLDSVLMRLCEMVMMVPGFYLLLALRAAVPENFTSLQVYCAIVVILSFIGWAGLARIIRGMCLSLRERDYILAARSMGVSDLRIILTHVLPHTVSYSITAVMLSIPGYILSESALSLIGLGIQDPYASWGNMLSDAMSIVRIYFAPWILWPAAFIFLTVVCFNVVGDALRDVFDPMLKGEELALMKGDLLSVKQLSVRLRDDHEPILRDVSFAIRPGSIVAVVGGSGSGKTTLGLAVMGLLPAAMESCGGEVLFEGEDILRFKADQLRSLRGRKIGMAFQEPVSAFDPVYTIGSQIAETLAAHDLLGSAQIPARVLELLALAGVPDPQRVSRSYPHELSGGLRQRAMVAQAVACGPSLLIADEPTSSLDVTIQARILELFARLRAELGLSVVFITHDLGIARHLADEVVVMCRGEVVERGPVASVLSAPRQSYTRELISAEGR